MTRTIDGFNNYSGFGELQQSRLSDFWFVRRYHNSATPYDLVTDHQQDAAQELSDRIEPNRGAHDEPYMVTRLRTEDWLRDGATNSGVSIDRINPVYFAFTREPERVIAAMTADPEYEFVSFRADQLNLSNWSFTMDDHFFARPTQGRTDHVQLDGYEPHPLHGRVMNVRELLDAIDAHGYPSDETSHNFEAQMWAHQPAIKQSAVAGSSHSAERQVDFRQLRSQDIS